MPQGLGREDLKALYQTFAPAIHRRARALLGRDADAWDVTQEVFEKLLLAGPAFRGESRPMTWVYRITTNVCLNHLRARKTREPKALSAPEGSVDQSSVEAANL